METDNLDKAAPYNFLVEKLSKTYQNFPWFARNEVSDANKTQSNQTTTEIMIIRRRINNFTEAQKNRSDNRQKRHHKIRRTKNLALPALLHPPQTSSTHK